MHKIACLIFFCLFSQGVLRAEEIGDGDESVKKNTTGSGEKQNRANRKNADAAMLSKFVVSVQGKELLFVDGQDTGKILGRIDLPSIPVKVVRYRNLIYAACRTDGLWVVDVSNPAEPRVASVFARGEDVVGLRLSGDLLVLSLATYKVQVLSVADPAGPEYLGAGDFGKAPSQITLALKDVEEESDTAGDKMVRQEDDPEIVEEKRREIVAEPSKSLTGRVIKVKRREVIVDRGTEHGVSAGDRIEILSSKKIKVFDPIRKKHDVVTSKKPTAVIKITYAADDWARGYLGRGDSASQGDLFRITERAPTSSLMFPPRIGGWWQIQFGLWPVIGVQSRAFSLMSFSSVGYQFKRSFKIEAAVSPFIAIMGKPHSSASSNTILTAAYSSRFFEMGVGGGYQSVLRGRKGFVIAQTIRLGCIDGLNLKFSNQLVLSDDNRDDELRFMIGSLSGEINIPLVSHVTLFLSGGGGSQYYGYGDAGIRTYVRGTGDPGTIIISSSLGIAYVEASRTTLDENDRAVSSSTGGIGVSFSIGLDLRL